MSDLEARTPALPYRIALVGLELFTALGALVGGGKLLADPSGARIGFNLQMLQGTPFSSYLVPGAVLVAVNGVGMLAVALGVILRWRRAVDASLFLGALLAAWIAVQVALIGYASFLQPLMFAVGVLIVLVALLAGAATRSGRR
jgi:hypothetical protein